MSLRVYSNGAENLSRRLETAYNVIGGSFLFLWVQDAPTRTLSYAATAHFTPVRLAVVGGMKKISKGFEINTWSLCMMLE
jgi:hypothetical protein